MNKEATKAAVEKTIDVVDEQVSTLERIPQVRLNGTTRQQQIIILSVTAGVSAALGAFTAWKLARRRFAAPPAVNVPLQQR